MKNSVGLHGIRHLKVYGREIIASSGSRLDVSAPTWNQVYSRPISTGSTGENGKHGKDGPRGEFMVQKVFIGCDVQENIYHIPKVHFISPPSLKKKNSYS